MNVDGRLQRPIAPRNDNVNQIKSDLIRVHIMIDPSTEFIPSSSSGQALSVVEWAQDACARRPERHGPRARR